MARPKATENDQPAARLRPNVSVIERRISNPMGIREEPVKLRLDKPYKTRWFNSDISGRIHQATAVLGWQMAELAWLESPDQITGLADMGDGFVRRGERGKEYLMVMYEDVYQRVQKSKQAARAKTRTPQAQRETLAQDLAVHFGSDEGSAAIMGQHPLVEITGTMQESVERHDMRE